MIKSTVSLRGVESQTMETEDSALNCAPEFSDNDIPDNSDYVLIPVIPLSSVGGTELETLDTGEPRRADDTIDFDYHV